MKYKLKPLVAALTVAAGTAHASAIGDAIVLSGPPVSLIFAGGDGQLEFSTGPDLSGWDPESLGGLMGALNLSRIQISAEAPGTVHVSIGQDEFEDPVPAAATTAVPISSIGVDVGTGAVLTVGSTGGFRLTGTRITGSLTGGRAAVTNLRFDFVRQVVYADLIGRSSPFGIRPGVDYVVNNAALWTFDSITGPTSFPTPAAGDLGAAMAEAGFGVLKGPAGYTFTAENVIAGLRVTQLGFDFFRNSLGLLATGANALSGVNDEPLGWGSLRVRTAVTAVPEPGTWCLALAGLLVAGAAGRRPAR